MKYPVTVDWIPKLPQIPFHDGAGCYKRIVMHQTANANDTARSERNFESGDFNHAFVHEFIDPHEIIQVANPQFLAYGAGHVANQDSIHLELCSAHTQADFERSFDMWCQRAAVHLANRKLGVSSAQSNGTGTLWSHQDVSRYLGDTNHTDPIEYLAKWGMKWQAVIDRVQQHYNVITKGEDYVIKVEDADKVIGLLQEAYRQGVTKITLRNGIVVTVDQNEIHRLAEVLRGASGQPGQ